MKLLQTIARWPRLTRLWRAPLAFVLCALSARFEPTIGVLGGSEVPLWPAAGVALWVFLTLGAKPWPAVFAGVLAGALASGHGTAAEALRAATFGTLQAFFASALLTRALRFGPSLDRVRDVVCLALVSPLAAVLGVGADALACRLAGLEPGPLLTRWAASALAMVTCTPVLLTLPRPRGEQWRRRLLEAAGLWGALLGVSLAVFQGLVPTQSLYSQAFLLFPVVITLALRFGPAGAAIAGAVASAIALTTTSRWLGPFADQVIVEGVASLQIFIGVLTLTGQLIAASEAERRRATEQSEQLAAPMRSLREGVLLAEMAPDATPRVLYVNEVLARMCGRSPQELLDAPRWCLTPASGDAEQAGRLAESLREGRPFFEEWALRHADGAAVHTELQVSAFPVNASGRQRVVCVYRDIRERKQMQSQLMVAERMASLGMVAAGVAHEVNNPLAYVINNLELAQRTLLGAQDGGAAALARARTALADASDGAERVRLLVRDLRTLSRDASTELKCLDLNTTLELAMSMTAQELRHRARLEKQLGSPPRILGSDARIGQAFLNLLVNAAQAIPEGTPERHWVRVSSRRDSAGWAEVEIADSGCGIEPERLAHIFEPFFTTKTPGGGTGLGLTLCRQVVTAAGGTIEVRSAPGKGTSFLVRFPPAPENTTPEEGGASAQERERAPAGRVLIIDDEVRLARSMKLLLQPPHEVQLVHDGEEAIALLLSDAPFDVVICDLQMPGSGGAEIYERLEKERPSRLERLAFFSGGAYTAAARDLVRRSRCPVLEKPVKPELLLETVDSMLAAARAAQLGTQPPERPGPEAAPRR